MTLINRIAALPIAMCFLACDKRGLSGEHGAIEQMQRLLDALSGVEFVCEASVLSECHRSPGARLRELRPGKSYVFDIPNGETFRDSASLFLRRLAESGYKVTKSPGPGPQGFSMIQVGGPLYEIDFGRGEGRYRLATTLVPAIQKPQREWERWRPESLVLTVIK